MLFHFRTPRTRDWQKYLKKLQKFFEGDDKTAHLSAFLLQAQEKRAILVKLLDECAKDVSRPDDIIKLLNEYLPILEELIEGVEANSIKLIGYLDIVWTSFLMNNINGKSLSNQLKYEKISCYILYGLAHYQQAVNLHHVNRQISQKTKQKHMESKEDFDPIFDDPADYQSNSPQIFDDKNKVKEISSLLKQAASIWDYTSTLYPVLVDEKQYDKIPEIFESIPSVLSAIALCNAQEFMIQLAVQTGKSPLLTSKLSMGVSDKLKSLDKSLNMNLGQNIYTSIKTDFILYMKIRSALYKAISLKYNAKLLKNKEKHGECIAYYESAIHILKRSLNTFSNKNKKNDKLTSSSAIMKKSINKQMQSVQQLYKAAKSENDSVYFDVVPKPDSLIFPDGKFVMKSDSFTPITENNSSKVGGDNDSD